ncbi:MAG: amidase family protein [Acidimicrobiales bacterium]
MEVLDATLARIDARNPALNAVIWRNDDDARDAARALGNRIASGTSDLAPFAGVPIPIKDLTPVMGQPLTNGSFGAPDGVSDHNELVVEALGRAGFIFVGRTNTPEFGSITVTENLRYGPTPNPWNTDYTTGGSSGGAGSALASGMFSVVHGNDGGGSIRIPASCCGLVGLKLTRGRVPSLVPGWQGMSTERVLTHPVADTAALVDVIGAPIGGPGPSGS